MVHGRKFFYLLVADYFSNFPLVRLLNNQMAAHMVSILKMMFSKHIIPAWVFTDQERQFTLAEFQEFLKCYRFEIMHLMPRYPQSNGFIESTVKITKHLMNMASQEGEDKHIAMLAYRGHCESTRKAQSSWSNYPVQSQAISTDQATPIHSIEHEQGDHDTAEAETAWALSPHVLTTPRALAEPISSYTVRSQTASLAKSDTYQDTHKQKPKSLPGPDQHGGEVHQEEKIHLTSSGSCQFRIIHTNTTDGTAGELTIANNRQNKCSTPTIRAHNNTKGYITTTPVTDLSLRDSSKRCLNIMN